MRIILAYFKSGELAHQKPSDAYQAFASIDALISQRPDLDLKRDTIYYYTSRAKVPYEDDNVILTKVDNVKVLTLAEITVPGLNEKMYLPIQRAFRVPVKPRRMRKKPTKKR